MKFFGIKSRVTELPSTCYATVIILIDNFASCKTDWNIKRLNYSKKFQNGAAWHLENILKPHKSIKNRTTSLKQVGKGFTNCDIDDGSLKYYKWT